MAKEAAVPGRGIYVGIATGKIELGRGPGDGPEGGKRQTRREKREKATTV